MRNLSKDPLVSVCLVTYNQERFIADAIESALMQQADFGFEIVIGDDCSTDGTREICEEYQRNYPDVIRLLTKVANLGLKKNFVTTLAECHGEYIAYLEGDDKWTSPHKLAMQLDVMERDKGVVLVHTDWLGYQCDTNEYISVPRFDGVCIRETSAGIESAVRGFYPSGVRIVRGSSIFFRKAEAEHCINSDPFAYIESDFPAFDIQLYQDMAILGRYSFINKVMMVANFHDSLSGPKDVFRQLDFRIASFGIHVHYLEKQNVPSDIRSQWLNREISYFANLPFDKNEPALIPSVLRIVDEINDSGGHATLGQKVMIMFMKIGLFRVFWLLYGKVKTIRTAFRREYKWLRSQRRI